MLTYAQNVVGGDRTRAIKQANNVEALRRIAGRKSLNVVELAKARAKAKAAGIVLDEYGYTPEGYGLIDFTEERGPV